MKKILLMFIILFQSYIYLQSQNLVSNPSFEKLNWCPNHYHDFYALNDCFYAIIGSPNVHNKCADLSSGASVPLNIFGYQYARTGNGYVSEAVITIFIELIDSTIIDSTSISEILGMNLKETLIKDYCYHCSFYVSLGNRVSNIATDAISMFLYTDSLPEPHGDIPEDSVIKFYPQITNPPGNIIDDTVNWVKIEGEFISNGGEKYIYIGDFKHLRDIHWKFTPYTDYLNGAYALYYIDDVSVYPCDAPVYFADAGKDTCISAGESVVLGSPGREEYLYWWSDGKRGIGNSGSITVSPTQTTTYYLVQKDFKFDETRDTVHIKVGNCLPLPPDYSAYDFAIYPNPNDGNFQVRFNRLVPEGAKLQLFDMLGRQIGEYLLTGNGNIAFLSIEVSKSLYYAKVVAPDLQTKSVKIVILK